MPLSNYISSSRISQPGVCTSTTRPASPFQGQCIFETDTNRLLVWSGTAWTMPNQTTTNPEALELIKVQTVGAAVSSVTVSDAFSALYDNYKIMYSGGTQSASSDIWIQIGGSTTGYYNVLAYALVTGTLTGAMTNNNFSYFPWIGGGSAGQASHVNVEVMNPFLPMYTKIRNGSYQNDLNYGTCQGEHRIATSYSSFVLGPGTGTMTGGTIRVYGYRNL